MSNKVLWEDYQIQWEEHRESKAASVIRFTADHQVTKELYLLDIAQSSIKSLTNDLVDDVAGLFLLFHEVFTGVDLDSTWIEFGTNQPIVIRFTFNHRTRFKTLKFTLELRKQNLSLETRLDQVAQCSFYEVQSLKNQILELQREVTTLCQEVTILKSGFVKPGWSESLHRLALLRSSNVGSEECLMQLIISGFEHKMFSPNHNNDGGLCFARIQNPPDDHFHIHIYDREHLRGITYDFPKERETLYDLTLGKTRWSFLFQPSAREIFLQKLQALGFNALWKEQTERIPYRSDEMTEGDLLVSMQ
jgi:hypothetical protein